MYSIYFLKKYTPILSQVKVRKVRFKEDYRIGKFSNVEPELMVQPFKNILQSAQDLNNKVFQCSLHTVQKIKS
jgi:hypothetical protein